MRAADASGSEALKKDPSADADAVAEAKKRYKGLKRQLEAEVGAKRARAARRRQAVVHPPRGRADDARAAKAAWKALKAQGRTRPSRAPRQSTRRPRSVK